MSKRIFNIAIDGPSGAGKSTIARRTADRLGIIYVDTGAIYRSVGLYVLKKGIDSKDRERIIPLLSEIKIEIRHDDSGKQRMILNGDDVSEEIRLPQVSIYASDVSAIPEVRSFLLELQRGFAREQSTIMDGRDIGTVVLPDADLKIFLTATPEDRAMRRYEELKDKGIDTTFDEVLRDVIYRDKNDSERAVAPLRPADDAVILDTTGNTLEKSIAEVYAVVTEHMKGN
jgi:cytidylate kinase